ncbi:MAG: ABC-F family ATP-binding cassette domain-containing protein [Planctomycetota bacterium]
MLHARRVSKTLGVKSLFHGVSLSVAAGDRVGIIGPNGAGKSTLLRLLAGALGPDEGEVRAERGIRTAFVGQQDVFEQGDTVRGAVVRAVLDAATERDRSAGDAEGEHDADTLAQITLGKVGFVDDQMDRSASSLSGGWKKRLSIASAIASARGEPDVLLLDEPTNHLDIEGLEWLETFLTRWTERRSAAAVFVSHDRTFLERVATRVAEISPAYPDALFAADGNYTEFLRRKTEFLGAQAERQRSLAGLVRKDLDWLSRGPQGRQTKAKGRIQSSHERMSELSDLRDRAAEADRGGSRIDFDAGSRKTRKLIEAKGIAKSMGGARLFEGVDLRLGAGDRLGLLGPNGSGKTTFLRVLTGELEPDKGSVTRADPEPLVVVFSQHRQDFEPGTLLSEALCPGGDHVTFRGQTMHVITWARRFFFADSQLAQPVKSLSGGELARVHIARIMLRPSDVLILDEPTNDLDIPTLEAMEESLEEYLGALVLVTHDRAMLDRLSTSVLALDGTGDAGVYAGVQQAIDVLSRAARDALPATRKPAAPARAAAPPRRSRVKLSYKEQREYDSMEADIEAAEQAVGELEHAMTEPAVINDHEAMARTCADLDVAQSRVAELYARWDVLERKQSGETE